MTKRPKGRKYRNLTARGGVIYYERLVTGRRIRISTKTADWDEAASFRDLYEQTKRIGSVPFYAGEVPTFAEFAKRYLKEDTAHLAETTRRDRPSYLRPEGPLGLLAPRRLDEIDPPLIREWWNAEIQGRGLTTKTGRSYLDVLSGVLGYAVDLGILSSNPVPPFRGTLRRRSRSQRGRAENEGGRHVRPIEDPDELRRILSAARQEGSRAYILVLLLVDAGLRMGEALGLTWGCVSWGVGEDDPSRSLTIERSRPRGGGSGPTKSGRMRRVALSRRLRQTLLSYYRAQFQPGPATLVLGSLDPASFRKRDWRRILKGARVAGRSPKDLRDTFASQLLTAGVQLGYISAALGHADVAVTARHYARWAGGIVYRRPIELREGEVPPDLLGRLESPQIPPTLDAPIDHDLVTPDEVGDFDAQRLTNEWALQDSNLGASGYEPGALPLS